MVNFDNYESYLGDIDSGLLQKIITERLFASIYTMQYVISMNKLKITCVSDNFEKVTGCEPAAFCDYQNFYEKVVVESQDFFRFLKNSEKPGDSCERKYTIHTKFGGRNVLLDYTYVRKVSSDIVEYVGIITNATPSEVYSLAYQVTSARLRLALEASGAGFFDWEVGSSEVFCDSTAIRLLGLETGHMNIRQCLRIFNPAHQRKYVSFLRALFRGERDGFDEDVFIESPSRHWVCISGKVITRDPVTRRPIRIAGTVRDISTFKNTLIERERENLVLGRQIRIRTQQLEGEIGARLSAEKQMLGNLERERELNAAKSIFVNMVSHEFRTPLSIVQTSIDLLQTHFERLSRAEIDQALSSIRYAVQRMTKMMNNILILGKVQGCQLRFTPAITDVLFLCSSVIDGLDSAEDIDRVVLTASTPIPMGLFVDAGLLEYIVSNLLRNALKYSANDTIVHVSLEYSDGKLILSVTDRGIGIPKQDARSIFKLFHRGSNVSNRQGIGVGMFIVKYCVNLHRGNIAFCSKEGEGTCFRVTLPAYTGGEWEEI